jgi:transposase-like protein
VILQCVRWYCKYGISYRDLEEMMAERGLEIAHTTLYRWVQYYAPELKNALTGIRNVMRDVGILMKPISG